MLRHAAALATERHATHLGVHWVRAERNEPAAAFLFSLPGVAFVPIADASSLGLQPLEAALMRRAGVSSLQHGAADASSVDDANSATAAGVPGVAHDTVALALPETGEGSAAAIETHVREAVEAGKRLRLADLPTADAIATRLPGAQRKLLTKRLSAMAAKARAGEWAHAACRSEMGLIIRGRFGGELCRHSLSGLVCEKADCPFVHAAGMHAPPPPTATADAPSPLAAAPAPKQRDLTYGQISQYKKDAVRPEAGVIVIPVEAAAAAAVSFTPPTAKAAPPAEASASVAEASPAASERADDVVVHRGFESKSSLSLHPETVHFLADALSAPDGGKALHEWVAAESERTHRLPEAFTEVWQMYERRGAQFERALGEAAANTTPPDAHANSTHAVGGPSSATATEGEADGADLGSLDVEALHARLRRMMRHSMHMMIQEANPESYYVGVTHLTADKEEVLGGGTWCCDKMRAVYKIPWFENQIHLCTAATTTTSRLTKT